MSDLGEDVNKEETSIRMIRMQDMDNARQDSQGINQNYNNPSNLEACHSGFVALSWILTGMFMYYYMGGIDEKIMGGFLVLEDL